MSFRLPIRWLLALMLAGLAFCVAGVAEEILDAPLALDGFGRGTAFLDGSWRFHLGDDAGWAAAGLDDSQWEQLSADQPWGVQGHRGYTGFGWYRRRVSVVGTDGETIAKDQEFALLMRDVDDAYEVYWNGEKVGQSGKLPPDPVLYFDQPAQTYGLGPIRTGVLAVRVWMPGLMSSDPADGGGFESVPEIGTPSGIAARKAEMDYRWLRSKQVGFGLNSFYVLVGVLSLFAWMRDRSRWMLFWMGLYCFYSPLNLLILQMRFHWPANVEFALMQPVYALGDVALWMLLLWLLEMRERPRVVWWVRCAAVAIMVAGTLDGLVALVGWTSPYVLAMQLYDAVLSTITLVLAPVSVGIVGLAIARSLSGERRLSAVNWLVAIVALVDELLTEVANAASQGIRFTHWTLSETLQAPLFSVNGSGINPIMFGNMLLMLVLVYAVYADLTASRKRQLALEQEFQSARELQQVLIPETLPTLPGLTMTSAYRPAQEVGGDFFEVISLQDTDGENGGTLVVLGDVSGKGLKAAMAVSLIVGALRTLAETTASPAEMLAGLNRRLSGRLQGGFATCIALRIEEDGRCVMASAGHLAPFLNGREVDLPGALPLGLIAAVDYDEYEIRLEIGDSLMLFTDGLLEARAADGELFGYARMTELLAARPSAQEAMEVAVQFGQDDDITVLALTRTGVGVGAYSVS